VTEPEIAGTLQSEFNLTRAAEKLIEMANERGGPDNITVVIVRLEKESKGWFWWLRRGTRKNSDRNGNAGGN
jgi:serine/threonine protein phosphatase PrpC